MAKNLSCYCDYNEAFTQYDQSRKPVGIDQILHRLAQNQVPLADQRILEGGFGTGAYIDSIRHCVGDIYGVEGSEQGLAQASRKMAGSANVHLKLGDILHLDFRDNEFHGYMVNQVLHHIDTDPAFPNLNTFLQEAWRVLKPGGVLIINTCTQEQLDPETGVYWNYKYIAKAARAMATLFIPVPDLMTRMAETRFEDIQVTVASGRIFHQRYYTDPWFSLEPDFQKGDSVYCFLTPEELAIADATIRAAIEDGSVFGEMARAAHRTRELGEAVIVSGRKPLHPDGQEP